MFSELCTCIITNEALSSKWYSADSSKCMGRLVQPQRHRIWCTTNHGHRRCPCGCLRMGQARWRMRCEWSINLADGDYSHCYRELPTPVHNDTMPTVGFPMLFRWLLKPALGLRLTSSNYWRMPIRLSESGILILKCWNVAAIICNSTLMS